MAQLNIRNRNANTDRKPNWEYRFEGASVGGKRKQISKSGFRTKKEAQEAGTKALAEYNRSGISFEPNTMSVSDFLDFYLENYLKINCRYNTIRIAESNYKLHIKPALGSYRLCALKPATIVQFLNQLATNGFSKNMVSNVASSLSGALNYAVEPMHFIENNPMNNVRMPNNLPKQKDFIILEPKEWNTIINRFPPNSRFYLPLMIGYYTGLRVGETFGLTWDDIDFEKKTLTVNKQLVKRINNKQSSWYYGPPKTDSAYRTIKFGDTLYFALKTEYERQKENELSYGQYYTICYITTEKDEKNKEIQRIVESLKSEVLPYKRICPVCANENGQMTTTDSFKYAARIIHKELNIEFNYHALRHTHATRLVESHVNVKTISERLGHSNPSITMAKYVANTDAMQNESVEVFEAFTKQA